MCGQSKIRIHAKSMKRFKDKVRALTCRKRGKSLWQVIRELIPLNQSRTALIRDPYAGLVWAPQ